MRNNVDKDAGIVRELHLSFLDLFKRNDGVLKIVTADNLKLTIKEADDIADSVNEFSGRVPHLLLIVTGEHSHFDQEFLFYISSRDVLSYTAVLAFVVRDVTERNIASTLLATRGPARPTMLFEEENEAIAWLKDQFTRSTVSLPRDTIADAITEDGTTVSNEIHLPLFDLYKRSDDIVVLVCKDYSWLTIKEIKQLIAGVKEITGGVPHQILVVVGKKTSIDKEARSYSVTAEADQYAIATAVVIKSWPQRVMGNLMLAIDKPRKPLKFFDSTHDAMEWLKEQKK